MSPNISHKPVLNEEVLRTLAPAPGNRVLDATIGLGGHASGFLNAIGPQGQLIGIDADAENIERAKQTLGSSPSVSFLHANFRDIGSMELGTFDVIFADIGVSSPHFDDPARGFSFREDGPLDMRLDRTRGVTAAGVISDLPVKELATVLMRFGEVRQAAKLAAVLKETLPRTTMELKTACERVFSYKAPTMLPQVFQALRIAVNDEIGALEAFLHHAPALLRAGGRLGVIAFHSLEDRIVKTCFRTLTRAPVDERTGAPVAEAPFILLTKKAIVPSSEEIAKNPRSRSAKFRAIRRIVL